MSGATSRLARALAALLALHAGAAAAAAPNVPDWILASPEGRVDAGRRFELVIVSLAEEELPDELLLRVKLELDERVIQLQAAGPASGRRRIYRGTMPAGMTGPVALNLVGRSSNQLVVMAYARPDSFQALTERRADTERYEPPLSENDPMYFVVGPRGGWTARFQLSFKYRLFDQTSGYGRERPWLSALYFGYTQNSLWDLSSQSKPFRDTSYQPSLFWKWERTDDQTWVDAARLGVEHESNGSAEPRSRSINIVFVRPEWYWRFRNEHQIQFTPKIYSYLDKDENPDIQQYRGYVDWRVRYDAAGEWITTSVLRIGTSGKGSLLVDVSKRARDIRFGPVGGYLHVQFFTGYGEDILDYNVRRPWQLRVGFAIVP